MAATGLKEKALHEYWGLAHRCVSLCVSSYQQQSKTHLLSDFERERFLEREEREDSRLRPVLLHCCPASSSDVGLSRASVSSSQPSAWVLPYLTTKLLLSAPAPAPMVSQADDANSAANFDADSRRIIIFPR